MKSNKIKISNICKIVTTDSKNKNYPIIKTNKIKNKTKQFDSCSSTDFSEVNRNEQIHLISLEPLFMTLNKRSHNEFLEKKNKRTFSDSEEKSNNLKRFTNLNCSFDFEWTEKFDSKFSFNKKETTESLKPFVEGISI